MEFDVEYLPEPKLQFGRYFEHDDSKTGLAEYGPFGKNIAGLHPSLIRLGFVGTRATIEGAQEWVEQCGQFIESENVKLVRARRAAGDTPRLFDLDVESPVVRRVLKILNRDFPGFNTNTEWSCEFQTNPRWHHPLPQQDVDKALAAEHKADRITALVNLFDQVLETLAKTPPRPDLVILALTREMEEKADAVQVEGGFFLNFRRAIKARAMHWGIPIQLIRRGTVLGNGGDIQERSTRAWNFCTALYYKADGVPWRSTTVEQNTCFIGISFFVAGQSGMVTIRSSVAQAFDFLGQGLVVRGNPFEWNQSKLGRTPHLRSADARLLISSTLKQYKLTRQRLPPTRVVIHKESRYWGSEHPEFDELKGLREGIADEAPHADVDFVTLNRSDIQFFREGKYPPARGTFLSGGGVNLLYTAGYIPFLETFPGTYVPAAWQITESHGGSSPKQLMREILELTKMNVNNCAYADGIPITLSFSKKIGEIMKHAEGQEIQSLYKFYM